MTAEGEKEIAQGYWDIDRLAAELGAVRRRWRQGQDHHAEYGAEGFPSRATLTKIMEALCGALFPLRLGPSFVRLHNEDAYVAQTLQTVLSRLYGQIRLELIYAMKGEPAEHVDREASRIIGSFADSLPALRELLDSDVEAAFLGDPAARSVDEVLICYPSMMAIIHHRLAHRLHQLGAPLVARIISEIAHGSTGIDIHPGAKIGRSFFIDHGTGVVIGETAIVGDRVRIYQGVTLGARSFPADEKGALEKALPRHPIIEDDVVIYAGATILGRIIIGSRSVIGGNVWLTDSVPADSNVRQAKAHYEVTSRVEVSAPHRVHALLDEGRDGIAENI
ncbi:serine acetyltransferase [Sphingobium sp. TA15]|uniref:serine O-acetyltransferase n=1 Tax=Sphingobium indicum (strain DSM 16413 / CCM 7287 / MTCC 6362 / UT26 / NBRC 101211 / UT26S) TaxID=452662 RepID=D4Z479_SPHIU|nr:serine O-acetyltransferase EpsC [Sphingobium indicum]BAI97411.1 serine O-acetyltransferase [Sphingobium indicum UT26S]BDD66827.1 serine acetyltransferase [Sphingobium sp. TA15]